MSERKPGGKNVGLEPVVGPASWWRVEVTTHEGQLVAIEPEMLAGKVELSDVDLETIRHCAHSLMGFAGDGTPTLCFYCGGSGGIDTDNNRPIGACPICSPTDSSTPQDYRAGLHGIECTDENCPGCLPRHMPA